MALFAGRRSSDRTFLLLQNLFCRQYLERCVGTSSIFAAGYIDQALQENGASLEERKLRVGELTCAMPAAPSEGQLEHAHCWAIAMASLQHEHLNSWRAFQVSACITHTGSICYQPLWDVRVPLGCVCCIAAAVLLQCCSMCWPATVSSSS